MPDDPYVVDPYGEAVANIVKALESALDDGVSGAMSEQEYSILEKVAIVLTHEDPTIDISPRIA